MYFLKTLSNPLIVNGAVVSSFAYTSTGAVELPK
jgi:hypothetical protein